MASSNSNSKKLSRHVAILRIAFGIMWAIDAAFKWTPTFRNGFLDQVTSAAQGQPHWLNAWFHFWAQLLSHNPHLFAVLTAIVESLIAIALLSGLARRFTYLAAAVFSLMIWSIAEGFGGPYTAHSTDIGAAVMYAVVFFALYGLERLAVPPKWSVDNYIVKKLSWWAVVANP
ncbi:MAG TPA: DoxX family membrane protein [Candidatus Saccharimonadales bacterium]|nr:DoxX family membrane protein [Candidatus Saccharimonadales bacterium]